MKLKITLAACAAATLMLALPARAAEGEKPTQQSRFATCAHESKGLKGEEHQKFMSECLKGHDTQHAKAEHERIKECSEDAARKNLHGDERRAFMIACMKG